MDESRKLDHTILPVTPFSKGDRFLPGPSESIGHASKPYWLGVRCNCRKLVMQVYADLPLSLYANFAPPSSPRTKKGDWILPFSSNCTWIKFKRKRFRRMVENVIHWFSLGFKITAAKRKNKSDISWAFCSRDILRLLLHSLTCTKMSRTSYPWKWSLKWSLSVRTWEFSTFLRSF